MGSKKIIMNEQIEELKILVEASRAKILSSIEELNSLIEILESVTDRKVFKSTLQTSLGITCKPKTHRQLLKALGVIKPYSKRKKGKVTKSKIQAIGEAQMRLTSIIESNLSSLEKFTIEQSLVNMLKELNNNK